MTQEIHVDASTAQNCCAADKTSSTEMAAWKALTIFIVLIALFAFSDYWLPSRLENGLKNLSVEFADSLSFFITHSIGLMSLLASITFAAAFLRSYIDSDRVQKRMESLRPLTGHALAAGFGAATPFCSCSAVPVFSGFIRSGIPTSQAISFLVASPLVNEIAVIMLASSLGWTIAGAYAFTGFAVATLAGISLRKFATPDLTEVTVRKTLVLAESQKIGKPSIEERSRVAFLEMRDTVKTTFVFIILGVAIGALIHGWVPTEAIQHIASWGPVVGVLAATALGVPLYSGIATVIPIITALSEKGLPMGTLLAFAMSVTALSLPEALLLRKVMKLKLLGAFFATVAIGIVGVGILFNILL